jgi:hypothetical protein
LKNPMEWVFSRQYAKQRASLTPALSGSGSKGLSHPRELRRTPSNDYGLDCRPIRHKFKPMLDKKRKNRH